MFGIGFGCERRRATVLEKYRTFWGKVSAEMHENRKTFVVYCVLRVLVIFCMVRQFVNGNYEGFFLCILTLLLLTAPGIVQASFRVDLPQTLEIIVLLFIFSAEILGEVDGFYTAIPFWDTILHTINGFLAAAIGYSLVLLLNKSERFFFELSPLFVAIVAFTFSMTIGVLWEFFEFTMDYFFGLDMQKDTVVTTISSVMLNPDGQQVPTAVNDIVVTSVNGQALPIQGYLDVGLVDTMQDLFVNFIGAIVFSVLGYLALSRGEDQHLRSRFIVHPKPSSRQAR